MFFFLIILYIGGIIGGATSHFTVEQKLREYLNGKFLELTKDANLMKPEDSYKAALEFYKVKETTEKVRICELRKQYLLTHHPDKNGNTSESNETFIKYQSAFEIIQSYRKSRNQWN